MKVRIRADSVEIEGYVNAVGRDSRKIEDEYGAFVEQIQPGAFALALNRSTDPIPILLDHDNDRRLGDTGTNLSLEEDSIGLHAEVTITDPEVVELARAKKLKGWSFGFYCLDNRTAYDYEARIERRVVTELELVEVSIIDDRQTPIYAGTSIHTRSEDKKDISIRSEVIDVKYSEEKALPTTIESSAPEETDAPNPNERSEEKKPIDYSKYHEAIERLRR